MSRVQLQPLIWNKKMIKKISETRTNYRNVLYLEHLSHNGNWIVQYWYSGPVAFTQPLENHLSCFGYKGSCCDGERLAWRLTQAPIERMKGKLYDKREASLTSNSRRSRTAMQGGDTNGRNHYFRCEILGSHSGVADDSSLRGYYAMSAVKVFGNIKGS
jgi:hypothetical protein